MCSANGTWIGVADNLMDSIYRQLDKHIYYIFVSITGNITSIFTMVCRYMAHNVGTLRRIVQQLWNTI